MEFEKELAFKALADETRQKIYCMLIKEEEMCACKLLETLDCNQSTLSHHMKILVESGLVNMKKDWKWAHYSINREKVDEIINFLKGE